MLFKAVSKLLPIIIFIISFATSCNSTPTETAPPAKPVISEAAPALTPTLNILTDTPGQPSPVPDLSAYAFPQQIDPAKQYLFYLHGKIIEDQGIPAISPDFGEYEYEAILKKLGSYNLVVISEQRPKDADGMAYARKIAEQVTALLKAGVPAKNITVVGASKGAYIAIYASHFLENGGLNFVIMGDCHPDEAEHLIQNQVFLYGNVLSIFDSADEFAGSCQELFSYSEGKGISRYDEIVLNAGTGHGILYKPLDEWVAPVVQWARKQQ